MTSPATCLRCLSLPHLGRGPVALPGHTQDSKGPHSCRGTDPSFWNPRQCSPLVRVAWSSGPMHKKSIKHLTGAGLDRPLTILSFLLWILWLNRPPLTPHCPPLPPSFQDRLDLSRELGTSPATLSTKIFSHICPRPVETAARGLLVLLLASESGSESNPLGRQWALSLWLGGGLPGGGDFNVSPAVCSNVEPLFPAQ